MGHSPAVPVQRVPTSSRAGHQRASRGTRTCFPRGARVCQMIPDHPIERAGPARVPLSAPLLPMHTRMNPNHARRRGIVALGRPFAWIKCPLIMIRVSGRSDWPKFGHRFGLKRGASAALTALHYSSDPIDEPAAAPREVGCVRSSHWKSPFHSA